MTAAASGIDRVYFDKVRDFYFADSDSETADVIPVNRFQDICDSRNHYHNLLEK